MSIFRLVVREIRQRKLNFALGLISVVVAAGCLAGAATLLRAYDLRTRALLSEKQAEISAAMAAMEDDYRKITKRMGFNVLILPKDQNLHEFYAEDYASKYMPEEYVERLANSSIVTVQHLLPSLQQKIKWPERQRTILLIGIRDEVPIAYRAPKTPILQPVAPGGMVVGHELKQSLGLEEGQKVRLMGREFEIVKAHPERGDKDDITVWINLDEAQALLDKQGLINGILALECRCAWADLPQVRAEISKILPETQVIEKATQALARAEARLRAAETAKEALEREKASRAALRREREALISVLVPLVIVAAAVWIGFLAWGNVRERREEIGILRAVGLRSRQVLVLFLSRAALIGAVGGAVGYMAGWALALAWNSISQGAGASGPAALQILAGQAPAALFDPVLFCLTATLAPLIAVVAGRVPAQLAAQQDPADILRGE